MSSGLKSWESFLACSLRDQRSGQSPLHSWTLSVFALQGMSCPLLMYEHSLRYFFLTQHLPVPRPTLPWWLWPDICPFSHSHWFQAGIHYSISNPLVPYQHIHAHQGLFGTPSTLHVQGRHRTLDKVFKLRSGWQWESLNMFFGVD